MDAGLQQLTPRPASVYYYDLDDIVTLQEKVPVQFELPCYRLGFLEPSSAEEHINQGSKMEIPCWLAFELCSRRRQIVSVELPKLYDESYRQIFKADAGVLDLHKMGPFFYRFGMKLLHFQHMDSGIVARTLLEVFVKRFRNIMDASQNASHNDVLNLKGKLDQLEVDLFENGQQALREFVEWQRGTVGKLTMSNTVSMQRKRKRVELEE